jgi:hypothetical protein
MTGYGQSVDKASGALVPPSIISLLPQPLKGNDTGLMDLTYMQFLRKCYSRF